MAACYIACSTACGIPFVPYVDVGNGANHSKTGPNRTKPDKTGSNRTGADTARIYPSMWIRRMWVTSFPKTGIARPKADAGKNLTGIGPEWSPPKATTAIANS